MQISRRLQHSRYGRRPSLYSQSPEATHGHPWEHPRLSLTLPQQHQQPSPVPPPRPSSPGLEKMVRSEAQGPPSRTTASSAAGVPSLTAAAAVLVPSGLLAKKLKRRDLKGEPVGPLGESVEEVEADWKRKGALFHRHVCENDYASVRAALQSEDADVLLALTDTRKKTALHLAAKEGHDTLAQMCLEAGADPNSRDMLGRTPLHLLGRTPVHLAACSPRPGTLLPMLLRVRPTAVNQADKHHRSPVFFAVKNEYGGREEAIRALCERGADPNFRDASLVDRRTPLQVARDPATEETIRRSCQEFRMGGGMRAHVQALPRPEEEEEGPAQAPSGSRLVPEQQGGRQRQNRGGGIEGALQKKPTLQEGGKSKRGEEQQRGPIEAAAVKGAKGVGVERKRMEAALSVPTAAATVSDVAVPSTVTPGRSLGFEFDRYRERFVSLMRRVQEGGLQDLQHLKQPYLFTASWMENVRTHKDLFRLLDGLSAAEVAIRVFNVTSPPHQQAERLKEAARRLAESVDAETAAAMRDETETLKRALDIERKSAVESQLKAAHAEASQKIAEAAMRERDTVAAGLQTENAALRASTTQLAEADAAITFLKLRTKELQEQLDESRAAVGAAEGEAAAARSVCVRACLLHPVSLFVCLSALLWVFRERQLMAAKTEIVAEDAAEKVADEEKIRKLEEVERKLRVGRRSDLQRQLEERDHEVHKLRKELETAKRERIDDDEKMTRMEKEARKQMEEARNKMQQAQKEREAMEREIREKLQTERDKMARDLAGQRAEDEKRRRAEDERRRQEDAEREKKNAEKAAAVTADSTPTVSAADCYIGNLTIQAITAFGFAPPGAADASRMRPKLNIAIPKENAKPEWKHFRVGHNTAQPQWLQSGTWGVSYTAEGPPEGMYIEATITDENDHNNQLASAKIPFPKNKRDAEMQSCFVDQKLRHVKSLHPQGVLIVDVDWQPFQRKPSSQDEGTEGDEAEKKKKEKKGGWFSGLFGGDKGSKEAEQLLSLIESSQNRERGEFDAEAERMIRGPLGILLVKCVSASELKDEDSNFFRSSGDVSDPFCIVDVPQHQGADPPNVPWKTSTKNDCLSPVWNEEKSFSILWPGEIPTDPLQVVIRDDDGIMSSGEFLGQTEIDLAPLFSSDNELLRKALSMQKDKGFSGGAKSSGPNNWGVVEWNVERHLEKQTKKGKEKKQETDPKKIGKRGSLSLKLHWIPFLCADVTRDPLVIPEAPLNANAYRGTLRIKRLSAIDLRTADWNIMGGSSDPFVTVEIQETNDPRSKKRENTAVRQKTKNPSWDETLEFSVNYPEKPGKEQTLIHVTIFDQDKIVGIQTGKDFLGFVGLPAPELNSSTLYTLPLRKAPGEGEVKPSAVTASAAVAAGEGEAEMTEGSLTLQVIMVDAHTDIDKFERDTTHVVKEYSATKNAQFPYRGSLNVSILSARDLPVDGSAFVEVIVPTGDKVPHSFKTPVASRSKCPVWNHEEEVQVNLPDHPTAIAKALSEMTEADKKLHMKKQGGVGATVQFHVNLQGNFFGSTTKSVLEVPLPGSKGLWKFSDFPLKQPGAHDAPAGAITAELRWIPEIDSDKKELKAEVVQGPLKKRLQGWLTVKVAGATGLPNTDVSVLDQAYQWGANLFRRKDDKKEQATDAQAEVIVQLNESGTTKAGPQGDARLVRVNVYDQDVTLQDIGYAEFVMPTSSSAGTSVTGRLQRGPKTTIKNVEGSVTVEMGFEPFLTSSLPASKLEEIGAKSLGTVKQGEGVSRIPDSKEEREAFKKSMGASGELFLGLAPLPGRGDKGKAGVKLSTEEGKGQERAGGAAEHKAGDTIVEDFWGMGPLKKS
uniref:C2 domain-containing protein n=1 Tax=Chromera velia CCMP2878 TaxID=1169474 RepID=A0A0G4FKF7_9ALVE|eukprot:Cvel_405.t1-p1 / transcript=Cvel_405.t1 / gene=Cvel_405 / organism=Chromera_velia_CCMP2878 / gene_product=Ankyrin repeat domain-containing protein 54, putative / transcript_product=Ankyrin repeat domain-containing protein 54, putative / location=Cvel_scaffold13:62556-81348(-) / protein_length=1839 / sequence_SO=supercontig / SO=protein_coding / is_pseudo=false